ncbi:uncharacterized protein [Apostichopus japonicus]|uniref:uncharacterized protein n=1 Tax=Stichopus japonicus TaxID=307972 RepID=UPI003AB5FC6A
MEGSSFHFGTRINNLLFANWNTNGWNNFIFTFLFFIFLAIALEAISHLELILNRYYVSNPLNWTWRQQGEYVNSRSRLLQPLRIPSSLSKITQRRFKIHVARCLLHMPRIFLGYLLMLAVMTYNANILIAVVMGSTIGYFLFGTLQKPNERTGYRHFGSNLNMQDAEAEGDKIS